MIGASKKATTEKVQFELLNKKGGKKLGAFEFVLGTLLIGENKFQWKVGTKVGLFQFMMLLIVKSRKKKIIIEKSFDYS